MGINGIEIEIDFSSVWENIVNFGSQNPAIIAMQIFLGGGWVVFLLVFIYGLYTIFLEYQQGRYLSKWQHVILAIDIPKNNIQTPKAVESIFIALAGTQTSGNLVDIYWSGKLQESFSFEVSPAIISISEKRPFETEEEITLSNKSQQTIELDIRLSPFVPSDSTGSMTYRAAKDAFAQKPNPERGVLRKMPIS